MRSSREGAASTQRLCVSQTHLAVEVARSRSRPPRVGRAAASYRLGPARHAGCQVHIAPHAEHTVGPQQGRLGLCPQEQRGTRHTGRERQRSWSLPGIQLQNVLPGESTSAAGLFPRYTGREHQRSWSLPVILAQNLAEVLASSTQLVLASSVQRVLASVEAQRVLASVEAHRVLASVEAHRAGLC